MFAAAAATQPTNAMDMFGPASANALRKTRKALEALVEGRTHGSATFTIDGAGALHLEEDVETFRQEKGEELDTFLIRVWAKYKIEPTSSITWSLHEGRMTAKIARRGDSAALRAMSEQLAILGAQVAQLCAYIGTMQHEGARAVEDYAITSHEFTRD